MTQAETRKLGIEFERRLQIMYPNSKFTEKLTSDTIYSILNEFLIKYIKQLYLALRLQKLGEIGAENVDSVLRSLCKTSTHVVDENDEIDIPEDYWMYLRSKSDALTRKRDGDNYESVILSNELIEDKDVNSVISKYDNYAGILRHPLIIMLGGKIKVLHDLYTTIEDILLVYYRTPNKFDVSNTPCELPVSAFDDLVSGAIKLYVYEYKFALAMSASNSKYNKLKKGIDKLAEDNKQEQ